MDITTLVPSPDTADAPPADPRLSIQFTRRITIVTTTAFFAGSALGMSHGAEMAGYQFRAENAHRLPKSTTGWFLYHKTKNYRAANGGVREGLRMGTKLGCLVGGFFWVEEAIDRVRGEEDFLSTVVAGMSVAGAFSAWSRFPLLTAARTIRVGILSGFAFGLFQDALSVARGSRPGYVNFLLRSRQPGRSIAA